MEELGNQHLTAMDGHFTPSDLRHEACELCKADSKSNIEFFEPFIFQNNDTAYQYRFNKGLPKQSIGQQRHLFPSLRKSLFGQRYINLMNTLLSSSAQNRLQKNC